MECNHNCDSCHENCADRKESLLVKPNKFSSVKKVIGVVSGKGGVGKSMVTSLLAVSLANNGFNVGILDADITGPSIPRAFGVTTPLEGNQFGTIPAKTTKNIQMVSTNLLLEHESDPVVWRGPVIANLVQQFWKDVIWKDIDFLLVDMPPGTADVPLTVFQSLPISGVIVVSTPQDLVSMIVEKAIKMAQMMKVPVLGLVENMSYFECPDCKKQYQIFGKSNIDAVAKEYGVKVLAKLPINPNLTALADKGQIEKYDEDYLKDAVSELENLPISVEIVAIPVDQNEEINHHFGKCSTFILYTTANQMVIGKHLLKVEETGHKNVVESLSKYNVHTVLGNHAGEEALECLTNKDMFYIFGLEGNADEVVLNYLYNQLEGIHDGKCDCCDSNDHCDSCDGGCGCHH